MIFKAVADCYCHAAFDFDLKKTTREVFQLEVKTMKPSHTIRVKNGKYSCWMIVLRSLLIRLIIVVLASIMAVLMVEIFVRVFLPQSLILIRPDIWIPEDRTGYRHSPNANTRINTGEREVRWRTDQYGFRIGNNARDASDFTLVALGDSFLAAAQVNYEDTMTAILEERLSTGIHRSVRILNAGVGGWNPNHYRIQLEEILKQRSVNGIIVFIYLGNDIIDRRIDTFSPRQPTRRHSFRIPYTLRWEDWVTSIFFPVNDFFEVRSHLFILIKERLKFFFMRVGLTAHYFPQTLLLREASADRWKVTANILEEISDIGKAHGVNTIFVMIPSLVEANPAEGRKTAEAFGIRVEDVDFDQAHILLGKALSSRDLTVVDTTSALRVAIAEIKNDIYGSVDTHLGKGGHQIVAKCIEDKVLELLSARISLPLNNGN